MKTMPTWTALALLAAGPGTPARAQAPGPKVYVSADMEGVAGVVDREETRPGSAEYERFRELMTAEVNAAVGAAYAAGASEVVVSDSHGGGRNLLVEALHPDARVVRSFPRELDMMHGIDASFGAALLIRYHAAAWQPGVLAHTGNGDIVRLDLNGVTVGEAGLSAAVAGHFGVPVILVSGDQVTLREMETLVPGVEGVEVKHAYGRTSALTLHPERAQQRIREGTRAALRRVGEIRPLRVETPVTMDLAFKNSSTAEVAALIPTVVRTGTNEIRVVVPDMLAAARFFLLLMHLDSPAG